MVFHSSAVYLEYFKQFLKSRLEYKGDFIASISSSILSTAAALLFIVFLIDGTSVPSLQGWTREEVLFIYGYSMLSMAIFDLFSSNLYRFGDKYIIDGQFDRVLLRPLNSLFQVLFESFNFESVGRFTVAVLLIIYTASALSLQFAFIDYVWLLFSALCGGIILIAVFVFLSSLSFHFEDRMGIGAPVFSLIHFSRYPLPIFNDVIQFVLRWVVPFAFVAFYPATHFLGRAGFEFFCYFTPVMSALATFVAAMSWKFGVSRYTSVGN